MNIFSFVNYLEGYWLYPIFHHLSTMQISLLFAVTGILFWFLYLTGENITIGNKIRLILGDGLNTLLWGKAPHSVDKSPRKPHLISKKKEWFDSDLTCHIRYITWPRTLQGYLSLTYHNNNNDPSFHQTTQSWVEVYAFAFSDHFWPFVFQLATTAIQQGKAKLLA